jgi:ribonucleoside-diphosphate reductase alpha chain
MTQFDRWYWLNDQSQAFLKNGYIPEDSIVYGEQVKQHFSKIALKAESILNKPGYADKLFDYIAKGYYLLPTPAITNFLSEKESAISCFGSYVEDSVEGLLFTDAEIGMLSKVGGGTSCDLSAIRSKGSLITGGGFADGPMRFVERLQDTTGWINQRSRRGKVATYLSVDHPDIYSYLTIKDRTSDIHEVPFAVKFPKGWIASMKEGDSDKREIWAKIIKKKFETGFPYLFFDDNVNDNLPDIYEGLDMKVNNSNLCTEILLPNSHKETFVCCIGAMNLVHYDEWKDTDAVEVLVYLLDAFLTDFINKNNSNPLMARAVRFAEQHRAIGVGASGYHSYLQKNMIAFESWEAKSKNVEIFKTLKEQSYAASEKMGFLYGVAPLIKDYNEYIAPRTLITRRHTTLNAIAPNTSSSEIVGQWSQSIEPVYSNYYIKDLAKVKYAQKNYFLVELLESKSKNTEDVWEAIKNNNGSVQHLEFLSEKEKLVFKTFSEISPMEILIQNASRTKYIDQGISFNTMIPYGTPAKEVSEYYLKAHEMGVKTCYYQLNQSAAQTFTRKSIMECDVCSG